MTVPNRKWRAEHYGWDVGATVVEVGPEGLSVWVAGVIPQKMADRIASLMAEAYALGVSDTLRDRVVNDA